MKKLYIVSKYPPGENNRNNLNQVLREYKHKKVLYFDLKLDNKKIHKLIKKYKKNLEDICQDKVDIVMFDKNDLNHFRKYKNDCNIYYFQREGLLEYFRKFLRKNKINEDEYILVGEKKYSPTSFIVKTKEKYVKLFTLKRGDDDSFYINFTGNYYVDSIERIKNISNKVIALKKIKTEVKNPYISYHPNGGVVHSKDYYGEYFIPNLKVTVLEETIKNNGIFPFCAIVTTPNYDLLPNIGKPPLELKKFNYTEINNKIPTVIINGLKAESFITFNSALLEKNQTLTIELWLHKKILEADVYSALTISQKKNIISYVTVNNEISDISWTAFFRHADCTHEDVNFSLLIQIFNGEEYTMCRLNKM